MLKRNKAPRLDRLTKIMELFNRHQWNMNTPRYANFCSLSGRMNDEEFALLYELTDRFHLLDINNFIIEFLMGYYSCDEELLEQAVRVFVTPMKEVDEQGKHKKGMKSGDMVYDEFRAKRELCEYQEKIVFCKDASGIINRITDNDLLCFVDDFVGSGKTYDDTYQSFAAYFQNNGKTLDKDKVFAVAAWVMNVGYETCRKLHLRLYFYRGFSKEISEYAAYSDIEKSDKIKLMQQMEISYVDSNTDKYSLGFRQSEALVSILDKSPNNTFPIYWKAKNKLNIFPRF